jgi:hypothetical protein
MLGWMYAPRFRTLGSLALLGCLYAGAASRAWAQAQNYPSPNPAPVAATPNAPAPLPPPAAVPAQPVPYQPPATPSSVAPAPYEQAAAAAPLSPAQPAAAASTVPPPAAAPPAQPAAASADVPEPEGREKKQPVSCLIGGFCLGPVLSAGGLNVFGIGVHARMDYWGIGFDYQFIDLTYAHVDGTLRLITVEGRVYPGGGAFFFAAGMAWQSADLESTVTIPAMRGLPETRANARGDVTIPMFKLGVGFMGRNGFVLGIDLGILFRLESVHVNIETDLPRIQQVIDREDEFRRAAEAWIEWFPFTIQFNVLRLGFLF